MNHFQIKTDKKLAVMSKGYIPDNTKRTTIRQLGTDYFPGATKKYRNACKHKKCW